MFEPSTSVWIVIIVIGCWYHLDVVGKGLLNIELLVFIFLLILMVPILVPPCWFICILLMLFLIIFSIITSFACPGLVKPPYSSTFSHSFFTTKIKSFYIYLSFSWKLWGRVWRRLWYILFFISKYLLSSPLEYSWFWRQFDSSDFFVLIPRFWVLVP